MSGPKHLWSGDWERESLEARRRDARPQAGPAPVVREPEPPPERRPTLTRGQRRLGVALAALVVGIGGVAYAAIAIGGPHSGRHVTLGDGDTAAVTVPAPTPTFSVPTTPTTPTTPAVTPTTPTTSAAGRNAQVITWLGAEIITSASDQAVVDSVDTGSVGGLAGLRPGDVIKRIDGQRITESGSVETVLRRLPAGRTVPTRILRDSITRTLRITLGAPPTRSP